MFVRWKRRKMRGAWARRWAERTGRDTFVLYAVLVKSERVEGKPRQRFVAHLAHIPEPLMHMETHRLLFWRDVNRRLDVLAPDPDTRAAITRKLTALVPFPDEAGLEAERERRAELESASRVVPT